MVRPVIMALRMAAAATEQLNHLLMAARKRDSEREGFVVAGRIPVPPTGCAVFSLSALK